jgi:hypothetical protein
MLLAGNGDAVHPVGSNARFAQPAEENFHSL